MRNLSVIKWFFIIWICLEIAGFVWVAEMLGIGWMFLLLIASTLLGITLLREEGLRSTNLMMQKARSGQRLQPEDVANMPFVLLGGVLLVIPGFCSDILGLLCFIPVVRHAVVKLLSKRMPKQPNHQQSQENNLGQGRTFDGEFKRED